MARPIWIKRSLFNSKAFRSLSRWGLLVLFDFYKKRSMKELKKKDGRGTEWVIKNNGQIVYPYSEAERGGICRRNFRNAIDELIDKGFLEINHPGGGGKKGDLTTYFIRDEWENYGSEKKFTPLKKREPDTREGRGWAAIWNDPKQRAKLLDKRRAKLHDKRKVQSSV